MDHRLPAHIREKINPTPTDQGCWQWTGSLNKGYGSTSWGYEHKLKSAAHRVVYTILIGRIPDGLSLDHTCHNVDPTCKGGVTCQHRACVNPAHMDPCTKVENLARSPNAVFNRNRVKTHCKRGHEFTPANTRIEIDVKGRKGRRCRKCHTRPVRRGE
jgi:hypothetical protein